MTDDEKIKRVTSKLTGEFYVGQLVRVKEYGGWFDLCEGVIVRRDNNIYSVDLGEKTDGEGVDFHVDSLSPL